MKLRKLVRMSIRMILYVGCWDIIKFFLFFK